MIDIDPARIDLLHLLVDRDGLQVETGLGVMLGHRPVSVEGLLGTPVAAIKLSQLLPNPDIPRIQVHQFLVVLNGPGHLAFLQGLLG